MTEGACDGRRAVTLADPRPLNDVALALRQVRASINTLPTLAPGAVSRSGVLDIIDDAMRLDAAREYAAPAASEGLREHEHYWVDAPDDETGWYCTICGLTEYPADGAP